MEINETGAKRLAMAVINHAVSDFVTGGAVKKYPLEKAKRQLDACRFLMSEEFQFWSGLTGRDLDVDEIFKNAQRVQEVMRRR